MSPDPRETMFPLELAGAAAVLKTAGHEVAGYEVAGADLPKHRHQAFWSRALASHDVIVIAPDSYIWPAARDLLRKTQPRPDRLIVVGGMHATLYTHEVLGEEAVDVAVCGECELAVELAIDRWRRGPGGALPGVVWQNRWVDRGFSSDADFARIDPLDQLPPPDRDVFSIDAYSGMATRRPRYTQIVAGRGSERICTWYPIRPPIAGGRRCRSVQNVVDEMAALHDVHGIDEFHFEDDGLLEDPAYVADLCRAIGDRLPEVVWQCPNANHPDDLHVDMLEQMAAAGCYRVYLALHSPAPAAMRSLGWYWNPGRIAELTDGARRVGLELGGYFTLGLPDESPATMKRTVRFAVDSGLAWAQFTPFSFTPGSQLYALHEELADRLPPSRAVRRAVRRAYWKFYGTRGRWRTVPGNLNRRNATQLLHRTFDKLIRGRPLGR